MVLYIMLDSRIQVGIRMQTGVKDRLACLRDQVRAGWLTTSQPWRVSGATHPGL